MKKTIEIDGADWQMPFQVNSAGDVADQCGRVITTAFEEGTAEYIAAALNDYRPWRYTDDGETPTVGQWYEVSRTNGRANVFWQFWGGDWVSQDGEHYVEIVVAFRELPSSAPERKK